MTARTIHVASTGQLEPPTLSIAEIDRDPHGVFRRYRPVTPLIRREDGSYLVIGTVTLPNDERNNPPGTSLFTPR